MSPDYVAGAARREQLQRQSRHGTPAPGLHGHSARLRQRRRRRRSRPDGSNRIPASPPPTFTVNFTNGGENDETNVKVTVEITGSGAPDQSARRSSRTRPPAKRRRPTCR